MPKICPNCERVYEDEHIFCAADGTALRSQSSGDDLIGSVVDDRYVISALLGEGGMGRVYLGQHVHLPRKVAIKVLHEKLHSDPAAVARFTREASNASRIEHERVARVFDFGRMSGGAAYLAMEYIEGRTLSVILDTEGALDPSRVVRLVEQIAEGVMAAHQMEIVHRDLKPDNVMIMTGADGSERVKIVDFGIAKTVGADEAGTLTAAGFITGTPEYMSPEQLLGSRLDGRSDVFALGLLAFRALTGQLPFAPPTPERGFSSTLTDTPKRLSEVRPEQAWPAALQLVFDRVLARRPQDRYATAPDFAMALHQALQEPATASLEGARVADPSTAPRVTTTASPAASPAVIGGAAVTETSRPGTAKPRSWTGVVVGVGVVAVAGGVWWWSTRAESVPTSPRADSLVATTLAPVPRESAARSGGVGVDGSATRAAIDVMPPTATGTPVRDAKAPPVARVVAVSRPASPPARSDAANAAIAAQLDAIRDDLDALLLGDESRETPSRAIALVARLDQLLVTAPIAADSARALLLKANLLKLAGQRERACAALDVARPIATSTADRNSVRRNSDLWSCRVP